MKNYNEKRRLSIQQLKKKQYEEAPRKTLSIQSIKDDIMRNRRTRKGQEETAEIIPEYQTRKTELKKNTLKSYMSKANIVHSLFTEDQDFQSCLYVG